MTGRLMSIFVATRVKVHHMLYFHFSVLVFSSAILVAFSNTSHAILWIGLLALGFGYAPCYPAIFSFIEERLPVTSGICGVFMLASSIATTVEPFLIGKYIDSWPLIVAYTTLGCTVSCWLLFAGLHASDKMRKTKRHDN